MKHFLFFGKLKALLFAVVVNFILFSSCKKYAPAPEAFFLKPDNVKVSVTSPTLQGTTSHKITDLFMYVNGKFQGVYQPGSLVPVTNKNTSAHIDIFSGIKDKGIQSTVITWLFYDKISFDTLIESGTTINLPVTFKYNPSVTFAWLEDFDGMGYSLIKSPQSITKNFKIAKPEDSFEGKSIMFECIGDSTVAMFESAIDYFLPKGNSNVYIELNYKCDQILEVGLTDGINKKDALYLNPKSEWNKIYIPLGEPVNREPLFNKQKVYFRLRSTNDNPNPHVWLDNIKLIYL
jgi:hypothetical protein